MVADKTEGKPDATLTVDQTQTPTYTKEQVDKEVRDARSAALADVGRLKQSADAAWKRLEQIQKEQDDAEAERYRDDPGALEALRDRQARRRAESDLATAQQQLKERDELLKQANAEKQEGLRAQNCETVAQRLNVDPARLAKLAKFTDGSLAAIEDVAKELPKKEAKPALNPDSGKALGGTTTYESIRDAWMKNPNDPAAKAAYLEARAKRGI